MKSKRLNIKFWEVLTVSQIIDTIIAGDDSVIKSFRNTINHCNFNPKKHPTLMDAAKLLAEFKLYEPVVRQAYKDKKIKLTPSVSTV